MAIIDDEQLLAANSNTESDKVTSPKGNDSNYYIISTLSDVT